MKSIWCEGLKKPSFEALKGDIKTDVLIIGGGLTGILCGYFLKKSGVDCIIAEAEEIFSGVTQNTTAKITCQHGAVYSKMLSRFGKEKTELYYKAQNEALREYENLSKEIDCDFTHKASVVYSLNDRKKLEKEIEALEKIGVNACLKEKLPLPFVTAGGVMIENQAEFHPLKFGFSLAENLKIFENTRVLEITGEGAFTNRGKIKAKKIIVATHFPFANKYGGYFIKMYQHRSYVLALKGAENVNGMYVDEADKGLSFRNYEDLLLLGGGGHRTGKKGGNWQELREFARKYYPNSEVVGFWATQDCKTLDGIPYIGKYSPRLSNVYVATGFNKWGMTSAMASARLLTDLILDKENGFSQVFTPTRTILRPQLAVNLGETLLTFITPTAPRCPHLGCALKYNRAEHSWDCPCHGSRFSEDGKLLDNPATGDL